MTSSVCAGRESACATLRLYEPIKIETSLLESVDRTSMHANRASPRGLRECRYGSLLLELKQIRPLSISGRPKFNDKAFRFYGGVCRRGIYDNMKTAVEAIFVGKARRYNLRFLQTCSHHLVKQVACTPASGWDLIVVKSPHTEQHMFDAWTDANFNVDAPGCHFSESEESRLHDLCEAGLPPRRRRRVFAGSDSIPDGDLRASAHWLDGVEPLRSRAMLEVETWILRQQKNVLRRAAPKTELRRHRPIDLRWSVLAGMILS
jgi:hypothetical protein